jgi:hypothetical protein
MSKQYVSQTKATTVIELFTSEGCSSCPPADQWLTQLKTHPDLFKHFIPMAFHVDYWDQLGWKDRFATKANSNRQYIHKQQGQISQVYTPGFVINNKEWKAWFNAKKHWSFSEKEVGKLSVNHHVDSQKLTVNFDPEPTFQIQNMTLHIAILGMGLSNSIEQGENRGRQLNHDFVVLNHIQHPQNNSSLHWQLKLADIPEEHQQKSVLVVWLSPINSQRIIQATGGYL